MSRQCKYCATGTALEVCGKSFKGYMSGLTHSCTRALGHTGPHVVCKEPTHAVAMSSPICPYCLDRAHKIKEQCRFRFHPADGKYAAQVVTCTRPIGHLGPHVACCPEPHNIHPMGATVFLSPFDTVINTAEAASKLRPSFEEAFKHCEALVKGQET